jgi:hypothetical protein
MFVWVVFRNCKNKKQEEPAAPDKLIVMTLADNLSI